MSTGDQELPLAASGEQIRQREFATVRRGYDPEQVRAYLVTLAARVDSLERDLAEAQTRLRDAESAPVAAATTEEDPYEQISRRFASVLESADAEAERVVEQARSEAERIKHEAKARAEEARIAGSQALTDAREESDRMLATLAERREAMLGQLHEMQSHLLVMTHDLEGTGQESTDQSSAREEPAPETPQGPEALEPPSPDTPETPGSTVDDLWVATDPPPSASASEDAPASTAQDDEGLEGLFDDPAVPQSDEPAIDLPDLSSIEFDFDEPEPEPEKEP